MGRYSERTFNKRIMNKINTAVRRAIKDYSNVIYERMKNNFYNGIDQFYKSYSPQTKYEYGEYVTIKSDNSGFKTHIYKYWKRQHSLYEALDDNKKKSIEYIEDNGISGFRITLHISGSNIKTKHHADVQWGHNNWPVRPNEWIFRRAYLEGIHGFTPKENKVWDTGTSARRSVGTAWHHNLPQFNPNAVHDRMFTLKRVPLPFDSVTNLKPRLTKHNNVWWIIRRGKTQIKRDIKKERLPFDLIMKYFK